MKLLVVVCVAIVLAACSSRQAAYTGAQCARPLQHPSLLVLVPAKADSAGQLRIEALDHGNGGVVSEVEITSLAESGSTVPTDRFGKARLTWPANAPPRHVRVRRVGYAPLDTVLHIAQPELLVAQLGLHPLP